LKYFIGERHPRSLWYMSDWNKIIRCLAMNRHQDISDSLYVSRMFRNRFAWR
jgi:hypothetical protein